jgi:glycosyltransferase involved in cell wall biosynthesis
MSKRLINLLKDETLRTQMGQNARESLDSNFSLTKMIGENENLYEDLIKNKGVFYAN